MLATYGGRSLYAKLGSVRFQRSVNSIRRRREQCQHTRNAPTFWIVMARLMLQVQRMRLHSGSYPNPCTRVEHTCESARLLNIACHTEGVVAELHHRTRRSGSFRLHWLSFPSLY